MAYNGVGFELMSRDDLPPEISSLAELEYLVRDQKKAFLYVRFTRLGDHYTRLVLISPSPHSRL
jgi:hypothetical protein